jgi:hypothetical protein
MIEDHFGLQDESYWTDPWANRKAAQRSLMISGHEDFMIGAPKVAALDRHRTLPLAILRVRKAQGGSPVDFRAAAVLAAWDKNMGKLNARLAFPKPAPVPASSQRPADQRPAGAAASKDDSFSGDATAMVSEASTLDLAARLKLTPEANEFIVSLVCMDKRSNGCRIKVIDSASFQDEAAQAFVRAYREEQLGPPRIHPEEADPEKGEAQEKNRTSYARQAASPGIPEEAGIALVSQRVTVIRADRPCLIHGSFRLPAKALSPPPSARPSPPAPVSPAANPKDSRAPAPTAIVPIALMLTGSVQASPLVLNLNVPSYAPLERSGGENLATGYFTFDLCAQAALAGVVQTYFIYAFSGEVVAGPSLAAFVNPVLTWKTHEEQARAVAPA